jgi:uncharacterized membrane protein (UPF0127 family)
MKTSIYLISLLFCIQSAAFKNQKIEVGGKKLDVEVATTREERAQGLMFRKKLPEGRGMLFVFEKPQVLSFWMKNTFIPLAIGFFDKNHKLIDIQEMEPSKSEMETDLPSYTSSGQSLYALEVPKGWFLKNKIKVGEKLKLK